MLLGKLMFQFTRFAIQALHLVFVSWLTIVFVGGSLFLSKFVTTSTIFSWSLGNLNISCCNNSQCTELLSAHCLHIQVHSFAHILSNKSHSRHLQTQVHSSTNTLCNKYYSQKSQNAVKPIAYKKKATVNAHLTILLEQNFLFLVGHMNCIHKLKSVNLQHKWVKHYS